jgi:hypothetical protein
MVSLFRIPLQSTIGNANYNALELSICHTSGRLQFSAAYTYAMSLDQSSNPSEEVNLFNPALSYAISSFDVKHNVVLSYEYQLPFDQLFHPNRLTAGWSFSGITHFASGFPVTMINNGDNSLIGTNPDGINNSSIDEPDYTGGPLHLSHNPRTNGNSYFSTTVFSMNALGTPGNAKRRFFYAPARKITTWPSPRSCGSRRQLLFCFVWMSSTSSIIPSSMARVLSMVILAARPSVT